MSEQTKIQVICACGRQEKFEHTIQTKPGPKKKQNFSLQVDCPYSHKEGCQKTVTVPVDLDNEPLNTDSILRHKI